MSSMRKAENAQCHMCALQVVVAVEFDLLGLGGPGPYFCSDCLARALTLTGEYWPAEPRDQGAAPIKVNKRGDQILDVEKAVEMIRRHHPRPENCTCDGAMALCPIHGAP